MQSLIGPRQANFMGGGGDFRRGVVVVQLK